jgi:prolyl-tRNA synthetase
MFRLKDRKGADLCLGMTHEEIMTTIARSELRSYKQLPQIWYQIQTKFRDEPRPKGGLLRVRQFTMKDAYSFDIDAAGLDKSYDLHDAVYRRIFTRCGLKFVAVEADSGSMGGSRSQEFMVYTDAGEDLIASCPVCGYAANLEKATSLLAPVTEMEATGDGTPELVHTPGCAAIADVAEFFKISPASDIKCVAYMALRGFGSGKELWEPIVAFLRGDHSVNETKLLGAVHGRELRTMNAEELDKYLHGPAGYLGPIGLKAKKVVNPDPGVPAFADGEVVVVLDLGLEGRTNMVCGANKLEYHLRNATPGRDFSWTLLADVLDINGKEVTPIMGSYGIGIERILTAAIEQSNDRNGFWLPPSIAPFTVVVTVTNVSDAALAAAGEKLATELSAAGLDVLLDDRDERAGVKFKDADLVGIPYRINVGKKTAEGIVELVTRATSTSVDIALNEVTAQLKSRIQEDLLLGGTESL